MPILLSLAALQVVMTAICGAACDDKVGIMITLGFSDVMIKSMFSNASGG